jgi:O-succinylhomoserine sulfhydrylase
MSKEKDISTLGVRAGTQRSEFGEHSEALFLTSSFVFENAAQAAERFIGGKGMAASSIPASPIRP